MTPTGSQGLAPSAQLTLDELNRAESPTCTEILSKLLASEDLARRIATRRPFASVAELCQIAAAEVRSAPATLLLAAINAHPPIGAATIRGSLSEREQSASAQSDPEVREQLRQLTEAYRQEFGMEYLVRAAGRSGEEILANLRGRIYNTQATELSVAREEYIEINGLRLRQYFNQDIDSDAQ